MVPESALKKTTVSEMLVTISGASFGNRIRSAGTKMKPPPAPINAP
jgi:hypothetical protein